MNIKLTRTAPILLIAAILALPGLALAQDPPAATPIPINLETPTPPPAAPGAAATATWTATPASLAVLEPLDTANVRAEPDLNGAQIGVIHAGEIYTVTGRYFEWYQFQYNGSPTGRAWVFGQIVRIDGDPNTIPEVTLEAQPTQDPLQAAGTQTAEAIVLTPGGDLTATAASRGIVATLEIPGVSSAPRPQTGDTAGEQTQLLPTFTYPPGIVMAATEPAEAVQATDAPLLENLEFSSDDLRNIPPIIPILVLGSLGTLGLMFSTFRRRK